MKISSFRTKAQLVFHCCLYNKTIYFIISGIRGLSYTLTNLCMVLYCLHLTILYKSITIKERSKTMINLTRLFMNLLGYWTSICNQCLGKCYQPFDCDYSRYHKKSIQYFLNMRHVYMTAVKGDFVHPLLVSRFPHEHAYQQLRIFNILLPGTLIFSILKHCLQVLKFPTS